MELRDNTWEVSAVISFG